MWPILILLGAAAVIAGWWLKRRLPAIVEEIARRVVKTAHDDFLKPAQQELEAERQKSLSDLELKKQAVQHVVDGLEKQLQQYQGLIRGFEADRNTKYGRLEGELQRVTAETAKLQMTTSSLAAVLGNSRVRGQWGQRIAEDILRHCGLQEGVHYQQEKGIAGGRPDYTFSLPEHHALFMDVKFPLERYLKFVESQREEERQQHQEAFLKDVKEHIREMEHRNYAAQSDRSVDYILIFIPNEQVYGLINEWAPTLLDECLQKKIILCGPSTLYAIVRIIWQAWQNYHYTEAIQDIVRIVNGFIQDYGKFKVRFEELGGLLRKTDDKYQDIAAKSFQRLDQKITRIEAYRKGQGISEQLLESEEADANSVEAA